MGGRGRPAELARRFWYDSLVFDRRAIRYLVDMLGRGPAAGGVRLPGDAPGGAGRADAAVDGAPAAELEDITWHNCFRFLGIDPPKLFSSGEQHRIA